MIDNVNYPRSEMSKFDKFRDAQSKITTLDFHGKDQFSSEVLEQYKLRNSFGLDPSKEIHRIFQKDYYDKDVSEGYLTLPIASSNVWGDSLENPLGDVADIDPVTGGQIDYGSLVRSFYALCWTERSEPTTTDWTNFSHGKKAVRITTTVGKLLDRLMLNEDRAYMHRIWLISVEYKNPSSIRAMKNSGEAIERMESTGALLAASAAVVRTDYSVEDEIRLLFDGSIKPELDGIVYLNKNRLLRIPFNWDGFVDRLVEK